MTDWKKALEEFLFYETALYEPEEAKLVIDWVEKLLEEKRKPLLQAIKVIKQWHNLTAIIGDKSKEVVEEMWHTYLNHAPEMKEIREALLEEK